MKPFRQGKLRENRRVRLPQSSRTTLALLKALWHRAIGSVGTWGWGISLQKPNLSTPSVQRRKTGARASLALNVRRT